MIAKPMHGFSHRLQQRIGQGKGIGTARSHDRKPSVGRLDGAAGDGRVQIKDAAVSCGGFHFDCAPRRNRCAGNDHGARLQPCDKTSFAEQDCTGLVGVQHRAHDGIGAIVTLIAAGRLQHVQPGAVRIMAPDFVTGADEGGRHAKSH